MNKKYIYRVFIIGSNNFTMELRASHYLSTLELCNKLNCNYISTEYVRESKKYIRSFWAPKGIKIYAVLHKVERLSNV